MATSVTTKTLRKITVYPNFHPDEDDPYTVQIWIPNDAEDEDGFVETWMEDHLQAVDLWEFAD